MQSKASSDVFATACDLRMREEAERMVREVDQPLRPIDVLINNAGIITVGPLEEMTLEDFNEAMESNFWSGVYTTMAAAPEHAPTQDRPHREHHIHRGKIAVPHLLPYSASKFAFYGFSRGLRSELMKDGIVVTTVVPGSDAHRQSSQCQLQGTDTSLEHAWFSISDSLPGVRWMRTVRRHRF